MPLSLGPQPVPNADAMHALGVQLAAQLVAGDVVALAGDLGAGKTTLVRGICDGLGIAAEEVSSPTFALCNVYAGRDFHVAHMDLYRLESVDDLTAAGLDEWLGAPDALCLIEWPEIARRELPPQTIWLQLAVAPHGRTIVQSVT